MSTDWDKYSTAWETLGRARAPRDNAIIDMSVEDVRSIPGQTVEHCRTPENRAHTDVIGKKDPEARIKFQRICRIVIPWSGQS